MGERVQVQGLLDKLGARQRLHCEHVYDVHAIVVYQGKGQAGHYVSFVRQSDGAFLCFDDVVVSELADAEKVREAINARSDDIYPASVRTLIYRRRSGGAASGEEALEIPLAHAISKRGEELSSVELERSPKRCRT